MSLRFIYGRSGSGKTHYCLNEIRTKIEAGFEKPLILLVPEQFTFQAEKQLINVLDSGGIINTEVLSFSRMAYRIFNEVGGLTYPHINSAGKCMIVYRLIDKMKNDFKMFHKTANHKGFVKTLTTLITEFKRYNITASMLESFLDTLDDDVSLKEKLQEINLIYNAFDKAVGEKYRNSDDDLTLAANKLVASDMYNGAEIWIDGFSSFTPQEYLMITMLLKKAGRVDISFCTDSLEGESENKGIDTFSEIKGSYKKLMALAKENSVIAEPSIELNSESLYRFKGSHELSHLEKFVNFYPYETFEKETHDIHLFASVNIFTEIEAAAGEIIELCRDKGMRFRDIGIVAGNLGAYESMIEAVFNDYEIPCFLDKKSEVINHPLIRMILSMMDIFIENWSYKTVFGYLKTGMTDIDIENIDILENYVLAHGIKGKKWTDGSEWDTGEIEQINSLKFQVTEPLMEFRKKTIGRRTASEICADLYDFLCDMGIPEKIEKSIEMFKSHDELSLANEYSQVWDILMNIFDQTVEVMGKETFGIERFSDILKIGLGEYKIGTIPASIDQVVVGNIERSKSHEIKAVFILGANDGQFPSSAMDEGVLSDSDRETLKASGIELASDTRTKALEERYLIYRSLTAAGQRLWISWPIADQDGKSLRPCLTISRIRKLFPNVSESSNILESQIEAEEIKSISAKTPAFKSMVRAFRRKGEGEELQPLWQDVYNWFSKNEEWKSKSESAFNTLRYKNEAAPINRHNVDRLYGETLYSSVSRLERYSACPFAYFAEYGLKAKDRKVYKIGAPDIGSFMHKVIEEFSNEIESGKMSWRELESDWINQKVSEIVDRIIEQSKGSVFTGSSRHTMLTKRLKRVVTRAVTVISEQIKCGSFYPVAYEADFGEGNKIPPIEIELDFGRKVKLNGRIDRVDAVETEDGTYIRIIDYKSGSKSLSLSDLYNGLEIQLFTYLAAIWENEGLGLKEPLIPAGMFYFHLDDPLVKSNGKLTKQEADEEIIKKLKMNGLILSDTEIIKSMDKTNDGTSRFIPAKFNKDGNQAKNSSAVSLEQFKTLKVYVKDLLKNVCEEILKGDVSIRPYKKKDITSCRYCSFCSFCQFDTTMPSNKFRIIKGKNPEEIWENIENLVDET
ncbi:MAG: helicase-exonuclease AddAB subunit AddB [Clostridia bacterium]|jgi:ATP-dependent helicase/nuclease subunit B